VTDPSRDLAFAVHGMPDDDIEHDVPIFDRANFA
jgi:hypothetical protein